MQFEDVTLATLEWGSRYNSERLHSPAVIFRRKNMKITIIRGKKAWQANWYSASKGLQFSRGVPLSALSRDVGGAESVNLRLCDGARQTTGDVRP